MIACRFRVYVGQIDLLADDPQLGVDHVLARLQPLAERSRPTLLHERGRVLSPRQGDDARREARGEQHVGGLERRALARRVPVVREIRGRRVALEYPGLLVGERGAERRDDVLETRSRERDDVEVPLDDDGRAGAPDRRPRLVQVEQHPPLGEDRCVRGVQVLGLLRVQPAPREPDDLPAHRPDRKHHAATEAVEQPARLLAPPDQAGVLERVLAYALPLRLAEKRVPGFWCPAEHERLLDLPADAAPGQVLSRAGGVGRFPQKAIVELRRQAVGQMERGVGIGEVGRLPVGDLHSHALPQAPHGVRELDLLVLHQERERVPAGLAAEAVVHPLLGAHRERGRLLGVERTEANPAAAALLELHDLADDLDDVGAVPDLLDDVVGNAQARSSSDPSGASVAIVTPSPPSFQCPSRKPCT